jgi:hypothetical protein
LPNQNEFLQAVKTGYQFKVENVKTGCGMFNGEVVDGADIFLPLKTMNRHGLIAGATGTGKTKTLQMISECLSDNSIPVLVMDIKGDLSGLAAEGTLNDKIKDRATKIGVEWKASAYPVELMTLYKGKGVRMRARVSEFKPALLSKILGLNDNQGGVVSISKCFNRLVLTVNRNLKKPMVRYLPQLLVSFYER